MNTPPAPMKGHSQTYDSATNTWSLKRKYEETAPPPAPVKGKREVYDPNTNTWTHK